MAHADAKMITAVSRMLIIFFISNPPEFSNKIPYNIYNNITVISLECQGKQTGNVYQISAPANAYFGGCTKFGG